MRKDGEAAVGAPHDWPRMLETLQESEARFQEAFEHAAIGMALISPAGRWLRVNPALCSLIGYSAAELFALTFQELTHPDDLHTDLELARQLLAGVLRTYQLEKRYIHKQGQVVWGLLSVSLVRNSSGMPRYFVSQIQDITERKRIELALRASEQRFRTLFEHSPDGVLLIDPHHPSGLWPIVDCNPAACLMNGYAREQLLGQPIDILHPAADTPPGRSAYLDQLRRVGTMRVEVVHRHANGTLFPITSSTTLITLEHRELVLGIDRDMTVLKQAEAALQAANVELAQQVAALEQHMHVMNLLTDMGEWLHACQQDSDVTAVVQQMFSAACPDLAGALLLRDEQGVRSLAWGPAPAADAFVDLESCRALRERQPYTEAECVECYKAQAPAGARPRSLCVPLHASGSPLGVIRLQAGRTAVSLTDLQQQVAVTVADQSALALASIRLRQSLHQQATRDPLTGLFNRRHMEDSLAREIARALRRQLTVGILLLDIDHFKRFNDTFGHPAGDALLRAIAEHVRGNIRSEDVACRYGGEELLLILAEVSLEVLAQRAEHLRASISQLSVVYEGRALGPITVSIGAALYPQHGTTGPAIVQAADAALYQAKEAGRNRVIVAG